MWPRTPLIIKGSVPLPISLRNPYDPPASGAIFVPKVGSVNSLRSGSSWVETEPSGNSYKYERWDEPEHGKLVHIDTGAGRYSLAHDVDADGAPMVRHVIDPLQRRVTFVYDSNSKIRRIVDVAGRITTLTVTNGVLTQWITPELCVTQMRYDGIVLFRGCLEGERTTYLYDNQDRATGVINPLGQRTTYAYLGDQNRITNPLGHVTTLTLARVTLTDASYTALSARSVHDANGERTTYVHDGNGTFAGTIDGLGNRTTYSYVSVKWHAPAPVGSVSAGDRTSYSYDSNGRTTNLTDPLEADDLDLGWLR